MKKLITTLSFALCFCASTVFAQTGPPTLPTGPLTSTEAYEVLVSVLGFSPVLAAEIVLRSNTAYGYYFTIDQALATIPDEDND